MRIESNLKELHLENCKISNERFLRVIFNLPNLEMINLSSNELKFEFTEIVKGRASKKIKELILSDTNISLIQTLRDLTTLESLEKLDISFNWFDEITADGLSFGAAKDTLKELNINHCYFKHIILESLSKCSQLKTLRCFDNSFQSIPENFDLGLLKSSLVECDFSSTGINLNGLKSLSKCSELRYLNLSGNDLSYLDYSFDFDCLNKNLKTLEMWNCEFTKEGEKVVNDFKEKSKIDLITD